MKKRKYLENYAIGTQFKDYYGNMFTVEFTTESVRGLKRNDNGAKFPGKHEFNDAWTRVKAPTIKEKIADLTATVAKREAEIVSLKTRAESAAKEFASSREYAQRQLVDVTNSQAAFYEKANNMERKCNELGKTIDAQKNQISYLGQALTAGSAAARTM